MDVWIVLDEELHRAGAMLAIANYGWGNEIPAQGIADQKGGILARTQAASRKIP